MEENKEKKRKNSDESFLSETANEDDETITLADILNHQKEIEEDAAAVLDGSDENFCTYSQGYIKRQALYACLSCVPESKSNPQKRAGVCLACSYKCHDGHELIELYTKRNFRCDCGTSKILAIRCKLDANKMEDNDNNQYNQNFSGLYCLCQRPYPDPDDNIDDEMIQCILCEDWYHSRHLETNVPDTSEFEEMICSTCTKKNTFLNYYSDLSILPTDSGTEISVTDTESTNTSVAEVKEKQATEKKEEILNAEINQCIQNIIETNKTNIQPLDSSLAAASSNGIKTGYDGPANKKFKLDPEAVCSTSSVKGECQKPKSALITFTGASFWPPNWRLTLCKCANCLEEYSKNHVDFLTDSDDTTDAYQKKGKAKANDRPSTQDQMMRALSSVDHVTQIEVITGYNKLKQKLTEFLTTFVANEQVITANDVNTFFKSMSDDKEK